MSTLKKRNKDHVFMERAQICNQFVYPETAMCKDFKVAKVFVKYFKMPNLVESGDI